ncbi:MAG: class I SAM-dependent methyltransferase [Candidatus Omnitrophota bacterium]
MYDFYFGTQEEIAKDEKKFLLSVKRMLPRWVNSIPDSEYLAIYDDLESIPLKGTKPVLAETGVGASTIVMLYFAMKNDGTLFSWDFQAEKGAYIRTVCTDTLSAVLGKNIFDSWKFIAYDSKSPYLGVPILKELVDKVDFCFLDSEHTLDNLLGEVKGLNPLLRDGSVVAIDDANYDFFHINTAYINMLRKKLGLTAIADLEGNKCRPFFEEVETYLRDHWQNVERAGNSYKEKYASDLFWSYYKADRDIMAKGNMEKTANLEHRYDSWRVSKRKRAL